MVNVSSIKGADVLVLFVGSNAFIGFHGNMFPVSWHVFEANPNYSPGPQVNPFAVSTNNTNTSAPLIEETFSNYTTKRIESVWQNSAVMIKWNHYVKIAEIFSFTNNGIDASIVVKNLNVTNTYISTFSLGMGVNSTMNVNGFNPSCQNISSGTGIIPSSDWNVSVGNLSINWQSEDSIFHSGIVSETSLGDQIILPFETGVINHNQSYTIDPMIYYSSYRIIGGPRPAPGPSPRPNPTPQQYSVIFTESGLPSGTSWHVTLAGNTEYSSSNSITFSEYDGSYSYSIGSVNGYTVSPSSGSVYVSGGSRYVSVAYAKQSYSLTFTESGLPSGTSWSLQLNGNTISTTSSSMTFTEPDGSYSYSIGSISGYVVSPSSGTATINGGSSTVSVTYTELLGANFYPYYNCNEYNRSGTLKTHNLTQEINEAYISNSPGGPESSYLMLQGTITSIEFNMSYYNANTVHYSWNSFLYGMFVYMLTPSGSIGNLVYANNNLYGNGIAHVSWSLQPGAYGGFMVEMVNNIGSTSEYYNHPFDVFSRLVNQNQTGCIDDSVASTRVYSSSGDYIGNLIITASQGQTSGGQGFTNLDGGIYFGLTATFYSPFNNVSKNVYNYGIFNYNQYLNYTGSQYGKPTSTPIYEPICSLNQSYSQSQSNIQNLDTLQTAEQSLYDLTRTVLILTADPCLVAVGITMVALGPFLFAGISQNETPYWGKNFKGSDSISYGSWDQGGSGANLPPWKEAIAHSANPCNAVEVPVYMIVNNGNGNPSYTQYLDLQLKQDPSIDNSNKAGEYALNYFTYSTSMTIVPISHIYTLYSKPGQVWEEYKFKQNDYVTAYTINGGVDGYNGPSYTAATSLPIYLSVEG